MRRAEMDSAVRRVRDIRLVLGALLMLSMTANLALTMSFAGRETVTVLVPSVAGPSWPRSRLCTNIRSGPVAGGRSMVPT